MKIPLPSCPQTHDEIRRRKEQIVLQKVLPDTAIPRLARMKQPLYNQEWMLHLAANRSFRMLDLPFPIRSFVCFCHAVLRGPFGNAVVHT